MKEIRYIRADGRKRLFHCDEIIYKDGVYYFLNEESPRLKDAEWNLLEDSVAIIHATQGDEIIIKRL